MKYVKLIGTKLGDFSSTGFSFGSSGKKNIIKPAKAIMISTAIMYTIIT